MVAHTRPRAAGALVGILAGAVLTAGVGVVARLATVVLALGYGAAVLLPVLRPLAGRGAGAFAPLGRMAFPNYLLQSLIFCFIFFGYGLGQFGRMGAAQALALGTVVYVAQ